MRGGQGSSRPTLLGIAAAAILGALMAVMLAGRVTPARASLPCGLLNPCSTTTTGAPPPTATTTPSTATTRTTATPTGPQIYGGRDYDGRAANVAWLAAVDVATGAHAVSSFVIDFNGGHCSNGAGYSGNDTFDHRATISSSGAVSETVHVAHASLLATNGKRITGTETYTAHLQFSTGKLTGTLVDTFAGAGLSCHSGTVHVSAYVNGSRLAPVRDADADTGSYRGDGDTMSVDLPLHEIPELSFQYTGACGTRSFSGRLRYSNVPIHARALDAQDGFGTVLHQKAKLSDGYIADTTITATGAFLASPHRSSTGRQVLDHTVDLVVTVSVFADKQTLCSGSTGATLSGPVTADRPPSYLP